MLFDTRSRRFKFVTNTTFFLSFFLSSLLTHFTLLSMDFIKRDIFTPSLHFKKIIFYYYIKQLFYVLFNCSLRYSEIWEKNSLKTFWHKFLSLTSCDTVKCTMREIFREFYLVKFWAIIPWIHWQYLHRAMEKILS